jgi:hypothetical protein
MANWVRDFLTNNPDKAGWAVHKRAQHSLHLRRPDGIIEAHFAGAPMHHNALGDWQSLDTALVYNPSGDDYGAPGLRPRLKLDRTNIVGAYSQRTMRVGLFDTSAMSFASKVTLPTGHVEDDCVVSSGSWWEHRIRLTETGLRETLTIFSKQTIAGAKANDWLVLDTIITGRSFADGELTAGDDFEGYKFPLPKAHDSSFGLGSLAPCKRWAKTISGAQHVFTGIPLSWLATAVYPVIIDPDYSEFTADGFIYGQNASFATARSTVTYFDNTYSEVYVSTYLNAGQYVVQRGFWKFNTSTIGARNIVTQVNGKYTISSVGGTPYQKVYLHDYDWSANDPITAPNCPTSYAGALTSTQDALWKDTTGLSVGTQYASSNLNTSWVNKSGNTYYAMLCDSDLNSAAPLGINAANIASQNHTTAGYRPILTVLYRLPLPKYRSLLGVGK